MVTLKRSHAFLLAPLLAATMLAACGDDSSDGDAAGAAASGSGTGDAGDTADGPVTIEHAFGTTTIEERPERIVSLNVQWTDVLLALGEQPDAYLLDRASGEEEPYPWHADRLEDSTRIDATDGLPYEQIAAQKPDLILVTYGASDQASFDRLAGIAPTIGMLGERQVDPWQDQIAVMGRVLGAQDRAQEIVDNFDREVADLAAELNGLEGKTVALANYIPGDSITVVADPEDGSTVLFEQLGMELHPDILAAADDATGRIDLSFEQVELLDADLLLVLPNDGDPSDVPGYDALPAVTDGAVAELEFKDVVGINTPTPLSVPYALDLIRPALEAAAT